MILYSRHSRPGSRRDKGCHRSLGSSVVCLLINSSLTYFSSPTYFKSVDLKFESSLLPHMAYHRTEKRATECSTRETQRTSILVGVSFPDSPYSYCLGLGRRPLTFLGTHFETSCVAVTCHTVNEK